MRTGTFHYDTDISAPIIIGTVPLRQFQEEQRSLQRNFNRDCNICSGSVRGGNIVTTQPMLRLRQELENSLSSQDVEEQEEEEEEELSQTRQKTIDDEPPSYDSCLPPSFSFAATFGSFKLQEQMEIKERQKSEENYRINIQLPQFPGYNTFNSHTQAPSQSADSLLEDDNIYNSYGSICTDHTGRSLDTLDVLSCDGAAAVESVGDITEAFKEDCNNELLTKVIAAVTESSNQAEIDMEADIQYIDSDMETPANT